MTMCDTLSRFGSTVHGVFACRPHFPRSFLTRRPRCNRGAEWTTGAGRPLGLLGIHRPVPLPPLRCPRSAYSPGDCAGAPISRSSSTGAIVCRGRSSKERRHAVSNSAISPAVGRRTIESSGIRVTPSDSVQSGKRERFVVRVDLESREVALVREEEETADRSSGRVDDSSF